jgi:hypothetical protein
MDGSLVLELDVLWSGEKIPVIVNVANVAYFMGRSDDTTLIQFGDHEHHLITPLPLSAVRALLRGLAEHKRDGG